MSTEITNNIDVSLDTTEVIQDNTKDIVNTNQHEVSLQQAEATVEGYKKEYSIVGDGLYASVTATETPQWLATLIDNVVANAIASGMTDYDLLVQDVRNAIDSIDVAKNTYVEQINVDAIVNGIVATHLDTLNATYGANFATKSELSIAIATTESAIAQDISDLSVSFADDLTSRVTNIQTAYAAADKVLAGNIDALSVAFIDQEANVSATADAVSGLQTYVGLGSLGEPDGTGILGSIAILQKQNDGIIEFTIDTYDVMIGVEDPNNDTSNDQLDITKEPYASWVAADTASGTEEVRASHIGDVYIQYADDVNGTRTYLRSYKFIKTAVDTSSPYSTDSKGYTWALVTDTDVQSAYVAALNAQGAADGKISYFYAWGGASAPADYDVTIDGVVTTISADNFKYWYKIDGKLYYKPSTTWIVVPTTSNVSGVTFVASGDLLSVFNPDTRDTTNYSYNGTSWQINGPDGIIAKSRYFVDLDAAVADNASAQADFEIAVKSYTKTSTGEVLSGMSAYQLGWTTDKTIPYGESDAAPIGSCQTLTYRDAVAFAQARGLRLPTVEEVASGIGAGSGCGFDSAYIWTCTPGLTPGTYYTVRGSYSDPSQIIERDVTLTAPCRFVADSHDKVEGASLYAQTKLEYNAPVTVNGITQNAGFGLVNELSDVTGAPSSGSEFWIDAQKFKFTNSNQTGATSPFTIDASGTNPQITFNGRVSFNSVTSVPDYALDSDARTYADIAQSNAINTASADAAAKANNAQSAAENTASRYVATLANSTVRDYWAACYGSAVVGNITYDSTVGATRLYNSSDTSIGMCTPAQAKGDAASFKITVTFRSNITSTSGVYFRIQEYDNAVLPSGKTHISGATTSESRVQRATREIKTLYEDLGVTTSWQTKTFTYTPTSTAQNFSFLVLNWDGLGTNSLYIRDISIVPQAPDISSTLPQTINRTYMPTASDVYPAGSIWRYSHSVNINGVTSTEYTHYLSQGNGVWKDIGGTYIDGSKIVTGSINAKSIAASNVITASAQIKDGIITAAKIGDAQISNAKIANGAITNAKIGDYIESTGFSSSGKTGWRIDKNGSAEFNGVVLSRQLLVASGTYSAGSITDYDRPRLELSTSRMIETNIPVSAWGGTNSTYMVAIGSTGTVNANKSVISSTPQDIQWGWSGILIPITRWSGAARLFIRADYYTRLVTSSENIKLQWKVYKVT